MRIPIYMKFPKRGSIGWHRPKANRQTVPPNKNSKKETNKSILS
jgi:hypothetical protein